MTTRTVILKIDMECNEKSDNNDLTLSQSEIDACFHEEVNMLRNEIMRIIYKKDENMNNNKKEGKCVIPSFLNISVSELTFSDLSRLIPYPTIKPKNYRIPYIIHVSRNQKTFFKISRFNEDTGFVDVSRKELVIGWAHIPREYHNISGGKLNG